tara:strand:- start:462 stop:764 length:303 start_codon:yes stop_codon:yes gene_type:complete
MDSLKDDIVSALHEVYDPEISVNVYDLGLIYDININDPANVIITMTLTSAFCPAVDDIIEDVRNAVISTDATGVDVQITFDPQWGPDVISEEGKLALGIF